MAEFLPLCDVLFNVISLAGYFCDVVFDVVFCYALLERGRIAYFAVVLLLVSTSLIISQVCQIFCSRQSKEKLYETIFILDCINAMVFAQIK